MSPVYLAAIALVIAVVIVIAVVGSKKHTKTPPKAQQLFDDDKTKQDDDLFEDVEIMADQDNGPSLEERFLAETVKEVSGEPDRLYNNTYVPTPDGGTHVVHLMLREASGFYIFRYLSLPSGWIVGQEGARWWIHFDSPEVKNYFDNPITTIDDDVKTMLSFFPGTSLEYYHGYVVVDDRCEIREVDTDTHVRVILLSDLPKILKADLENNAEVFSPNMDRMMSRVLATMKNNVGLEQRLTHLKKEMQEENEQVRKMRTASDQAVQQTRVYDPNELSDEQKAAIRKIQEKAIEDRKQRPEDHFTRSELALRESLILWRKQQANAEAKAENEILSDEGMIHIITVKPKTIDQLQQVSGMDQEAAARYGEDLLEMVKHMPV